jgi:hypothetical protein
MPPVNPLTLVDWAPTALTGGTLVGSKYPNELKTVEVGSSL